MKYPAAFIANTVQGPEPVCAKHAEQLQRVLRVLAIEITFTPAGPDAQCRNCHNEAAKAGPAAS